MTEESRDARHVWLLATTNPAKRRELLELVGDLPVEWLSLGDARGYPEVEETGATFEENAVLKARAYSRWSGLPAMADDGGLEIDALGGAPGVYSHRWAGDGSDEGLIAYTLERLRGVPMDRRGAQMRVALAVATPEGRAYTSTGTTRGVIAEVASSRRDPGFPYRSLFFLPLLGKYWLDLTHAEHTSISHRIPAVAQLVASLRDEGVLPAS